MRAHNSGIKEVERFNPNVKKGLTSEQVEQRIKEGKINTNKIIVGKTTWEILRSNVFTFFNILLFVIAGFMIYANVNDTASDAKWYNGLFFVMILLSNIIIGLVQDIKAKRLMVKMSILNRGKVSVIRDGEEKEIDSNEVVLDDVYILKAGDQIAVDSVVLDGFINVDESCVTGESIHIQKKVGSTLFSGTTVVSGRCIAKAEKVGKENSMEALLIKAKSVKRNPSHILRSLKILFRILGIIIIFSATTVIITYALHGSLSTKEDFVNAVRPFAVQFVAMIPAGLNLLTSVALVSGVLSLYRKGAYVQELYSIEMLARSDVLCVDKTGTITSGEMHVINVDILDDYSRMTIEEVGHIISNVVAATGDTNATAVALREKFGEAIGPLEVLNILPFNSTNKYSGATFASGMTYLIGAYEKMNIPEAERLVIEERAEEWASKGYRVIVTGKGSAEIDDDTYEGIIQPFAIIVLEEKIKANAKQTFDWFEDNGVEIKVISGDN